MKCISRTYHRKLSDTATSRPTKPSASRSGKLRWEGKKAVVRASDGFVLIWRRAEHGRKAPEVPHPILWMSGISRSRNQSDDLYGLRELGGEDLPILPGTSGTYLRNVNACAIPKESHGSICRQKCVQDGAGEAQVANNAHRPLHMPPYC